MQIVELKVNVEKSQLAQLEAQVSKLDGKKIDLKVNVQGLQGINKEMTNFVNAMARYQGASAKIASANAKQRDSESKLAIAQEKTAQTANKKAEAHSKLLTQMQRTQTAERNLQTQIQKTNTERQRSITQAGKVRAEEVKLQQQMERTRRVQEQNAKGAQAYGDSMQKAVKEVSGFQRLMGGSLGEIAGRMFMWQAMGEAVAIPIRAMKEAVDTMKAVDDELVEIRKVTDFNKQQLKDVEEQAYRTASAYGETADAYLQNVAAFARAGYQERSADLAELSTKTQIVADTTADIANQFLLSTDAAYHYGGSVQELTRVLDGVNEIENKNATSIEKIAEGMGLVAPVASQARVGVDELSAALGTITAVTQRSGAESARAMRALILNILGDTQTEVEEGVTLTVEQINNMKDVLKQYAPEALKAAEATGEVINPMKAIEGLAKAFQEGVIDEQKLMEIVTDIGGKLRSSQLLALIQNWDMYEKMLDEYRNAAGSADKEVENAMDSWTRKTNVLKNTWTEFVNSLVSTDAIKTGIDGVTAFFSALTDGIEAAKKDGDFWDNLWDISHQNNIEKETQKVKDLQDAYDALTGPGSEYQQLLEKSKAGETNQQEERRLAFLKAQSQEMERQIKLQKEEAFKRFQETQGSDTNKRIDRKTGETVTIEGEISKDVEATNKLTEAQDKLFNKFKSGEANIKDYRDGISKLISDNADLYETLSQFDEWGFDLSPAQQEFLDFYNWMLDTFNMSDEDLKVAVALEGLEDAKAGFAEFAGQSVADGAKIKKALEEVGASAETIQGVMDALAADGTIIIDVEANGAEETLSQLEELGIVVETENGKEINIEGLTQLADDLGMSRTKATELITSLAGVDGVSLVNAQGQVITLEEALSGLKANSAVDILIDAKDKASEKLKAAQQLAEKLDKARPRVIADAVDSASEKIRAAIAIAEKFDKLRPKPTISVNDQASGPISRLTSMLASIRDKTVNIRTNTITTNTTISVPASSSGNTGGVGVRGRYAINAEGTQNYKGGPTLLGDELSPDGSPRPELVIRRSGDAFIAGVNGPVATTLPAGSRIFNYRETMDILSGRDILQIPAYANAQGGGGGGAKPKTLTDSWLSGKAKLENSKGGGQSEGSSSGSSPMSSGVSSQKASSGSGSSSSGSQTGSSSESSSSSGSSKSGSSKSGSSRSSSGSKSSSGGSEKDEYLESLKKQLEVLEAQYSFLDASDAETDDLIAKSREIQTQLHVINDYLRATGGEEKDIWDNSTKWHQELKKIRDTQKKVYEDQRALLESELSLYEKQGWSIDDQLAKIVEIQGVLEDEAEFLREIGAEQVEINAVSLDWMVLQEKRRELERSVYQNKRAELETELELYEAQGWSVEDRLQKLKEIQKTLEGEAKYLREIGAAQSEINQLSIEWMAVNDQIREMEQGVYQDRRSELEIELKMYEAQNWSASDKLWKLKEIQKTLEDEANYLRSIGAAQSEINELSIQWMEVNEQILQIQKNLKDELDRAVSKELKEAQEKRDAEIGLIDKQIDKLKEAREVQEDQLELEEKRKKVEEARFALENAQNERTVRFFNKEKNQWEWGADPNQVKSAKESLENAKEDLDEYLDRRQFEAQIKALEDQKALINNRYDALEERWDRLTEIFDEPIRDIRDILQDLLDTGAMNGAQIDAVQELVGEIKTYTGNIFDSVSGRRTSATARAADGSTYNIGSKKGIDFLNNAPRGATMTGGDGSTWAKNTDLSTTITKNGKSYTVGGNVQYDIGSDRGLDFIRSAEPGDVMIGGDGSEWTKHPDGSVTIYKNGTTYTVAPNAFWNNGNRTAVSADGERYLIGSKKGLDFISNAEYGQTMTGGDGSLWEKMANGSTKITKNDKTFTVYDGGGILSGLGGIKWTGGDEMILPPDLTDYMLRPTADSRFVERMNELRYIYGNKSLTNSLMSNKNQSSQDHYGDVYTFGDVTMTEEKAKSTTVYELAQLSRSLGIYKNS